MKTHRPMRCGRSRSLSPCCWSRRSPCRRRRRRRRRHRRPSTGSASSRTSTASTRSAPGAARRGSASASATTSSPGTTVSTSPSPTWRAAGRPRADGKTWTFHIIEGMKWHDGVPLTARDIAFTYNLILETQDCRLRPVPHRRDQRRGARRHDAGHHDAQAQRRACWLSPSPSCPSTSGRRSTPTTSVAFKNWPIVGSGPFRVAELEKGKCFKLAANPQYPHELGGPPTIDEVYFVINQNTDSMIQDYKAGDLDAIVDSPATLLQDPQEPARHHRGRRRRPSASTSSASTAGPAPSPRATRCSATSACARPIALGHRQRQDQRHVDGRSGRRPARPSSRRSRAPGTGRSAGREVPLRPREGQADPRGRRVHRSRRRRRARGRQGEQARLPLRDRSTSTPRTRRPAR